MTKDKSEKKEHKKKKETKENGDVAPDADVSMAVTEPDDVDERVCLHFSSLHEAWLLTKVLFPRLAIEKVKERKG